MNAPTICDPFVPVTAGAFLALSVFAGGLGALWIIEGIHARRLKIPHSRRTL